VFLSASAVYVVGAARAPLSAATSTVEARTSEIHANAQRMLDSTGHEFRAKASANGHDRSEHQNRRESAQRTNTSPHHFKIPSSGNVDASGLRGYGVWLPDSYRMATDPFVATRAMSSPSRALATARPYYETGCESNPFGSLAMWMRVTRGRLDTASIEEALKIAPEITAAFKRMPGYMSYVAGGDRTTGQSVSVSTWDTEEHARFSSEALGDALSRLRALNFQIDGHEFFEVTAGG
jgi:hypothetical protein